MLFSCSTNEAPFEFRFVAVNDQNCTVCLAGAPNHVWNEVLMARGVQNNELVIKSLEVALPYIYGHTSHALFFVLIHQISELKTSFTILLRNLFNFVHVLWVYISKLVLKMPH